MAHRSNSKRSYYYDKKDYIKIAAQFEAAYRISSMMDHKNVIQPVIKSIVKDFTAMLKSDNPRFDRNRFLAACGISE